MKSIFNKFVLCSIIILSFIFISACGKDNDNKGNENITPTFENFEIVGEDSEKLSFNGNNDSVSTLSSNSEENPFGKGKKTIEEKINEEIDIGGQVNIAYTADINEYIYAITKIKNSGGKVISSITINGQRYTSNLFEDGSTKEKLILKLNVGNQSQIKNYKLEKIKYIDGDSAKDITITGNIEKLVKVGDLSSVTHQLSNLNVTDSSISFSFNLTDNSSLISNTHGSLLAILYDGNSITKKTLTVGMQNVAFDNLNENTMYQYAVIATYDKLDGQGKKNYILTKDSVTTNESLVSSYTITKGNTSNGVITVASSAKQGDLITVTVTPNNGYQLNELYYTEQGSSAKYTINNKQFTMPNKDITIYATFVQISSEDLYTITVEKVGEGTFDVASSAEEDEWVDFTATPNQGYKLYLMYYIEEGDDNPTYFGGDSFIMPANNITIYVIFERAYTISVANVVNGEISVDTLGVEDESISVELTPNEGYKLKELYYIEDGETTKNLIEESFWGLEFDMPASNITIYAIFEEIQSSETLVIDSKEDLISLSTNEEDWNKNISLTSNIDLGGMEWTPIGNYDTPFEGVFNGNGHTISNFKITDELDYVGLFGYVEYGTITNLKITDYTYNLDYSDSWGEIYIGGLVASVNYGNIEKNYASGNITMLGGVNVFVGGLIGEAVDTSIKNSYTNGNITGALSGYMFVAGGLVGIMDKDDFFSEYSIQYCYSTTNVSITNIDEEPGYYQLSVGGLVGESDYNISNSYATGNVSAISNNFPSDSMYSISVGGLVAGTGAFASVSGYELDTQNIFATDSEYTSINDDATKYTLEQILNQINSSFFGWDDEIWNLSSTENPTLK